MKKDLEKALNKLGYSIDSAYILTSFPENQLLMEEDWFEDEAILDSNDKAGGGHSTYLIPLNRIINLINE